jgi:hypothetical protein
MADERSRQLTEAPSPEATRAWVQGYLAENGPMDSRDVFAAAIAAGYDHNRVFESWRAPGIRRVMVTPGTETEPSCYVLSLDLDGLAPETIRRREAERRARLDAAPSFDETQWKVRDYLREHGQTNSRIVIDVMTAAGYHRGRVSACRRAPGIKVVLRGGTQSDWVLDDE